ncbi:MAG: putative response regulator receiver domain protein [Glaciihabitans sp.]|jgi:DNA-binding response OmpR family regulator|nr:putative response regulator receiver domain protein [Glaciihabitans sp.]
MSRTVVLADDDSDIRALVAIAAQKAGMEVIGQGVDGDDAWELVQALEPDVVILDVSMPGKTGLEVCRLIKAHASLYTTRVLVLSAAVDEGSLAAGMAAGADHYLFKPFSPRDLAAQLSRLEERA